MTNFKKTWKKGNKKGASLVYAMLIMLVCTVIASVVLAAATAAAGRIVKTSGTDRRYYAVNSTVNMVKDILSEAEYTFSWSYRETSTGYTVVTIDYLKNSTYAESFEDPACLSELLYEQNDFDGKYWTAAKYGTRQLENLSDIFMNASLDLLVGTNRTEGNDALGTTSLNVLVDAWNSQSFDSSKTENNLTIKMEGSGEDDCEVTMTTSLEQSGRLSVTIVGGADDSQGNGYAVTLIFKPDIEEKTMLAQKGDVKIGKPTTETDGNNTTTTTQNVKRVVQYEKNVTYRWNLDSVVTLN